jgi:Fungal chitosanase of glycosyl hydrolase group 75
MRYNAILFVLATLLCFSAVASAKQGSALPESSQARNSTSVSSARDCDEGSSTSRLEGQAADRDPRPAQTSSGPSGNSETAEAAPVSANLDQDLKLLAQRETELAQCVLAIDAQTPAEGSQGACSGRLLLNFEMRHGGEPERDIPIGRLSGSSAFFYESGMTIDADGAPNAYHPDNTGLDDLVNAGTPGRWEGLAKDADGEPFIQGPNDPFPGYYVSATALADHSKPVNDPARYVDASRIPFLVLPGGMARQLGARPGDFAVVFNLQNGKSSYALFGDVGPYDRIGEGSVALAENLGIRSDARNGGARRGILYLVFPGSGNGSPRTIEEINEEGQKLLQVWESSIEPGVCTVELPARTVEGNRAANERRHPRAEDLP